MPMIGFGTWDIRGKDCIECVKNAISCGYRMIDTVIMCDYKIKSDVHDTGKTVKR